MFGGLPTDNIQETERLYQNLEKALEANPNSKITDLFCIQTKNGLEFIDKHSFAGSLNQILSIFGAIKQ